MTAASRARFAEVVRTPPVDLGLACLLVGVEADPELDVADGLRRLDDLAAAARPAVPAGCSPRRAATGLRDVLGGQEGFAGSGRDYDDVRSSLLPEVLRRRRGLPLTLSVVWVEVARRLEVPAWPLALPGHVMVALGDPTDPEVVDPFAGGVLARERVGELVRTGLGREPGPEDLRPADPVDLLLRLLTNVRVLTARQPPSLVSAATRLWAVELSLLLPRHPVGLRRERGELRVRLGDHLGGAAQLEEFADLVDGVDEAGAAAARQEARAARARLN